MFNMSFFRSKNNIELLTAKLLSYGDNLASVKQKEGTVK